MKIHVNKTLKVIWFKPEHFFTKTVNLCDALGVKLLSSAGGNGPMVGIIVEKKGRKITLDYSVYLVNGYAVLSFGNDWPKILKLLEKK